MTSTDKKTNENQPLVSIIVPTYNVERYVEECIESLLNQTYSNLEIIVLDDGSTDATVYLLKQYEDKIHLIANSNNKGQGARRNEGIKLAQGKYIYFVDSDDWIEPETVEETVTQLEQTQAEIVRFNGLSFYDANAETVKEGRYNFSDRMEHRKLYENEEALDANRRTYSASPCLYVFKKSLVDRYNLKFLEGVLHEDEYFTTKLFAVTRKMTYLNRNYYHRRYRTASTMTESTKAHQLNSFNSYLEVFKGLEAEYQKAEYNDNQKAFIKRQLLSIYNGLATADVPPNNKKKLKYLKSVAITDKLYIMAVNLTSNFRK